LLKPKAHEKETQSTAAVCGQTKREVHLCGPYSALLGSCCAAWCGETVGKQGWANFQSRVLQQDDGLDCIWLVDETGSYDQTIDHEDLHKFFEIQSVAKQRSLYGRGRPQFPPLVR
jgi:hypothetical protein